MRYTQQWVPQAIEMYTVDHLTLRQIGQKLGVSATSIWKALGWHGVKRTDGTWAKCDCTQCGAAFHMTRVRWRRHGKPYCSTECYVASMRNPAYVQWRSGERIARKAVSEYFGLQSGMVVHHHDSDNRNNEISNLAVFASQADHMSFERGGDAKPIWDGALLKRKRA